VPKDFVIWRTGTAGQAKWLESFSSVLNGNVLHQKFERGGVGVPNSITAIFSLDYPDLVVATIDGTPLISIEITDQQPFGTNGQQRMARCWLAAYNEVPVAYVLPLEGYQIEEVAGPNLPSLMSEPNEERRNFLTCAASLPGVGFRTGTRLWNQGFRTENELLDPDNWEQMGLSESATKKLEDFAARHVTHSTPFSHIDRIPTRYFLTDVEGKTLKAYIRPVAEATALLLEAFEKMNERSPSEVFNRVPELKFLFRSNGVVHLMESKLHPELNFQNLPPEPGESRVSRPGTVKDDLELFMQFVDESCLGSRGSTGGAARYASDDGYFDESLLESVVRPLDGPVKLHELGSRDYSISRSHLCDSFEGDALLGETLSYEHFHVLSVTCNVERGLGDPYSGMLATRDLVFCRENFSSIDARKTGLVLNVIFGGLAAARHTFLEKKLRQVSRARIIGADSLDLTDLIKTVAENFRIEEIPKDIRLHLLLCDFIVISRKKGRTWSQQVIRGLPNLVRTGLLKEDCVMLRSMHI